MDAIFESIQKNGPRGQALENPTLPRRKSSNIQSHRNPANS